MLISMRLPSSQVQTSADGYESMDIWTTSTLHILAPTGRPHSARTVWPHLGPSPDLADSNSQTPTTGCLDASPIISDAYPPDPLSTILYAEIAGDEDEDLDNLVGRLSALQPACLRRSADLRSARQIRNTHRPLAAVLLTPAARAAHHSKHASEHAALRSSPTCSRPLLTVSSYRVARHARFSAEPRVAITTAAHIFFILLLTTHPS